MLSIHVHFSGGFIENETAVGTFLLTAAAAPAELFLDVWFSTAVLIGLTGARTAAHADIFDRAAEAGHLMSLEMGQADKDIGVHDGAADLSFFDVFASGHRNSDVIGAF